MRRDTWPPRSDGAQTVDFRLGYIQAMRDVLRMLDDYGNPDDSEGILREWIASGCTGDWGRFLGGQATDPRIVELVGVRDLS